MTSTDATAARPITKSNDTEADTAAWPGLAWHGMAGVQTKIETTLAAPAQPTHEHDEACRQSEAMGAAGCGLLAAGCWLGGRGADGR